MTEQSQTKLSYSRDFLITFSNTKKHDPTIQTLFKDSLKHEKSGPQVPNTVERSRNLRPEPKRQEQYLTPSNMSSKWKSKGPVSPESARKPAGSKDRQWRPSGGSPSVNKENVVNAVEPQSASKSKFGAKANVTAVPSWEAVKAFPEGKSQKPNITPREHKEEPQHIPLSPVVVKVVSASPNTPSPSPSPSAKSSAAKSPSQLLSPSAQSPNAANSPSSPKSGSPKIIDEHQMDQRQKQVDYGFQTLGYLRYRLLVPKDKRSRDDPRTPKKSQACSKRSWDGQIKKWRRDLHQWDPEDHVAFMSWLESDFVVQMIKNNIGTELLDLLKQIKERAAKFENSPGLGLSPSPVTSPASGKAVDVAAEIPVGEDLDKEKIVRKLVF